MNSSDKIFVAGHRGLVGSAIVRKLEEAGYSNILMKTRNELDLRNQAATDAFFGSEKPDYVFLASAKVGGILANSTYTAEFIYDNVMIASNVVEACRRYGATKLVNLGSSCIYPRLAPQPLKEDYLMSGPLEPTNEPYAIAKITAIKLCRYYNQQYGTNFISAMPTNLYGPGDNFDLKTSHVLPALLRKTHEAKTAGTSVQIWGDGTALREFLYVDDLAEALVYLMTDCDFSDIGEIINIGTGVDCSITELAHSIAEVVGYEGEFIFDTTKPNGTPRKLLDVERIHTLGWKARTSLEEGLARTYRWFLEQAT